MADFDLDAMLSIDDSEIEDVNDDLQASVDGEGDGGLTAGERDQQEGIIAGGASKAIAGATVLAGILSQVKSVQGVIGSVFSVISRALLPAVEVISDILRPINEAINRFIEQPVETGKDVLSSTGIRPEAGEQVIGSDRFNNEEQVIQELQNQNQQGNVAITQVSPSDSADQTGEGFLTSLQDFLQDPLKDKTGGGTL